MPNERGPPVTVVTVTHERPASVRRLLASLRGSGRAELARIVLVDDSPAPPDYAAEFPELPVDHVVVPQRVFISRAKNLGLERVRSEFVYFLDDDNLVDPSSIDRPCASPATCPRATSRSSGPKRR